MTDTIHTSNVYKADQIIELFTGSGSRRQWKDGKMTANGDIPESLEAINLKMNAITDEVSLNSC